MLHGRVRMNMRSAYLESKVARRNAVEDRSTFSFSESSLQTSPQCWCFDIWRRLHEDRCIDSCTSGHADSTFNLTIAKTPGIGKHRHFNPCVLRT